MHTREDLLVVVLQTLRALVTKQFEALDLQATLMQDLVRGQEALVQEVERLAIVLGERSVH